MQRLLTERKYFVPYLATYITVILNSKY